VNIQVVGHTSFLGKTGYNSHSQNFFTKLKEFYPVRIRNYTYTDNLSEVPKEQLDMIIEQTWRDPPHKIGLPFTPNPKDLIVNIVLNETHHYYFYHSYSKPMIAYNVWESTLQPAEYFDRILEYDQFWCPTEWQRQCTIAQGYPEDRVKVVPEGVDSNIFYPILDKDLYKMQRKRLYKSCGIPEDKFTFMVFGRWDYRKSTEEIVRAFNEEFKDDNNVVLILSADNPFASDGLKSTEERLDYHKLNNDKIKVLHFPNRNDYIMWLKTGNVFLSCSRSEGWNLPLIEAIASGTPSICSDWGAQLEFAKNVSHLVNVPEERAPKNLCFVDEKQDLGVWGEPDFEHLKYVMRRVYDNYEQAKKKAIDDGIHIGKVFTWNNAAEIASKHISKLSKKYTQVPVSNLKMFECSFKQESNETIVTFKTTKDLSGKYIVSLKDSKNEVKYSSEFTNLKKGLSYWISTYYIDSLMTFEIESELKLLYSKSKEFEVKIPEIIDESNKIKLNIGCGNAIEPGYINIDRYNNTGNIDMNADLAELPFKNNSVDEIYTSHVFEHINLTKIYGVVEEWKRVLKIGGKLNLHLPDLETEVKKWLEAPDDKKWFEVHRIFGGQTHEGNAHYCGFNCNSLKSFLERFDFKIDSIKLGNSGFGTEIQCIAVKEKETELKQINVSCHFVDGPFAQVTGDSEDKGFYQFDFLDKDNNSHVHQYTSGINNWTRPYRKYFTNWTVEIRRNGKLAYKHQFDCSGKNVLISLDSKSLGDTIAWFPYVLEFKKKHNCAVFISTFWNNLFKDHEDYKNLTFINPGTRVENIYASYSVGCHDNDLNKNKVNWRTVPLQKVASDILGLEYKEIIPSIGMKIKPRTVNEKYITISEHSTFQCKYWMYPNGWQSIVDYLDSLGYRVMVISKEETSLKNVINRTNRPIEETISNIYHGEFFIGVSAGPSWLAWALRKPVILISGYSKESAEFSSGVERIINTDVCHGCFNKVDYPLDRGDWHWCPRLKGTSREFECAKQIDSAVVIKAIDNILGIKQ